jgi:hypothetical protein
MKAQLPPGGVLLQPTLKTGPLAQECFVGHLDKSITGGEKAMRGQRVDDLGHRRVALSIELGKRDATSHEPFALAGTG